MNLLSSDWNNLLSFGVVGKKRIGLFKKNVYMMFKKIFLISEKVSENFALHIDSFL